MRLIRALALGTLVAGYATIVLGGYVNKIGAGLACPDWPTCHGAWVPPLTDPWVAAEYLHRLAAFVTGILALGTLGTVWGFHRERRRLAAAVTASFSLLAVQVTLGMVTIASRLDPLVVTAHLAVATAFIVAMTVAVLLAFQTPASPGSDAPPSLPLGES